MAKSFVERGDKGRDRQVAEFFCLLIGVGRNQVKGFSQKSVDHMNYLGIPCQLSVSVRVELGYQLEVKFGEAGARPGNISGLEILADQVACAEG